jgi:hypothetical protein
MRIKEGQIAKYKGDGSFLFWEQPNGTHHNRCFRRGNVKPRHAKTVLKIERKKSDLPFPFVTGDLS